MSTSEEAQFRERRVLIQDYVVSHRGLLARLNMHGVSGELFTTLQPPTWGALGRLLAYGGRPAQDAWRNTEATLPSEVVVKIAVVEDTPERTAAAISAAELGAMQRLTLFGSPYAPVLYQCCRFALDAAAYLNVIVMERVAGLPLSALKGKPVPRGLATALKNALKDLRAFGVLHYDLHTNNVLWWHNQVKIIDFGASIVLDVPLWTAGAFQGDTYDWHGYMQALERSRIPALASISHLETLDRPKLLDRLFTNLGLHPDPAVWDFVGGTSRANGATAKELDARSDALRESIIREVRDGHVNVSFEGLRRGLPAGVRALLRNKAAVNGRIMARPSR